MKEYRVKAKLDSGVRVNHAAPFVLFLLDGCYWRKVPRQRRPGSLPVHQLEHRLTPCQDPLPYFPLFTHTQFLPLSLSFFFRRMLLAQSLPIRPTWWSTSSPTGAPPTTLPRRGRARCSGWAARCSSSQTPPLFSPSSCYIPLSAASADHIYIYVYI